jgi:hypothetical protein
MRMLVNIAYYPMLILLIVETAVFVAPRLEKMQNAVTHSLLSQDVEYSRSLQAKIDRDFKPETPKNEQR